VQRVEEGTAWSLLDSDLNELPNWVTLRQAGFECAGGDVLLGLDLSLEECLSICQQVPDCHFVASGFGGKKGRCFWQLGNCTEYEADSYDVYQVLPEGASTDPDSSSRSSLLLGNESEADGLGVDIEEDSEDLADDQEQVDLLITEEGWGLSSANWLIRRSDWSISFLDEAFRLCNEEMPLFGDQDAMIHLLLNERALLSKRGTSASAAERARARSRRYAPSLDPHAVIIPQHEINAYDALNAFYMEADAYKDDDLLITFPGCKEAAACNPLFRVAAAHAREGKPTSSETHSHWSRVRVYGPPEAAAHMFETARSNQR